MHHAEGGQGLWRQLHLPQGERPLPGHRPPGPSGELFPGLSRGVRIAFPLSSPPGPALSTLALVGLGSCLPGVKSLSQMGVHMATHI